MIKFKSVLLLGNAQFDIDWKLDLIDVYLKLDGQVIGRLNMLVIFNGELMYDLIPFLLFRGYFPKKLIININNLWVDNKYRLLGIGSKILQYGINRLKRKNYNQFILNAYPTDSPRVNLSQLVTFYKLNGFKLIHKDKHNVIMGIYKG